MSPAGCAGGPSPAPARPPRGRRDLPAALIIAGTAVSCAAFAFCVIASADGWHRAVTGPGIAVSLVAMTAWVLAARLRGDDQ